MVEIVKHILLFCSINGHGKVDHKCFKYMTECTLKWDLIECENQYILTSGYNIGNCTNPETVVIEDTDNG